MVPSKPEQFKNDASAYSLIDAYLKDIQEANPEELTTHLLEQMRTYKITRGGPVLKAINVIRGLIEAQGEDPDELIKKREEKTE